MEENTKVGGKTANKMGKENFCKMPLVNGEKDSGAKEKELDGLMKKLQISSYLNEFHFKIFSIQIFKDDIIENKS